MQTVHIQLLIFILIFKGLVLHHMHNLDADQEELFLFHSGLLILPKSILLNQLQPTNLNIISLLSFGMN